MRVVITKESISGQDPVPAGIYQAKYNNHSLKDSKAGNPTIWLTFVLETQGANPEIKTIGKKVVDNITLTEDSLWRANELYNAATGEDLPQRAFETEEEFTAFLVAALQNKPLLLDISIGVYKGKPRNSIDSFSTPQV